jgi:DNA-binding GntR family transcriptional regulator
MSRTPVREALVRLQNEHFVQLIPRHGMRVVPLSVQDLRDVYEVLTALELTAIERLARSDLDRDAIGTIEHALDAMDLAVKRNDVDAWVKADEHFHRTLFTLCGNARLTAMADALWEQGHRARMTTVRLRASLETSNREHRALVGAIRRHDWHDARARHAKHRARATGDIIKLLQQTRLGSF